MTMHVFKIVVVLLIAPVSAITLQREAARPNATQPVLGDDKSNQLHLDEAHLKKERRDDEETWRTGIAHSFSAPAGNVVPPKCPADVAEDSPYMQELVLPDEIHTICKYRQPCDRKGSNLERLQSIRGLLARTKQLMNDIDVPYAIYGGSAIGQHRCRDVLPWDSDCDVVVWMEDVHKIASGDLDGVNGKYSVVPSEELHGDYTGTSIPFVVADKTTGFYCDVFFMHRSQSNPHMVGLAWPWGHDTCYSMSNEHPFSSGPKKCDRIPGVFVEPFVPCVLNGIQHTCFQDQAAYLDDQYGYDWESPNISTQPGGGKKTSLRQAKH